MACVKLTPHNSTRYKLKYLHVIDSSNNFSVDLIKKRSRLYYRWRQVSKTQVISGSDLPLQDAGRRRLSQHPVASSEKHVLPISEWRTAKVVYFCTFGYIIL